MTRTDRRRRKRLAVLLAVALAWPAVCPAAEATENWKTRCAMCHGKAGKPTPVGEKMGAKDVTSEAVQAKADEELASVVARGAGKMPGYEDQLTPEEIAALIRYIRALARSDE